MHLLAGTTTGHSNHLPGSAGRGRGWERGRGQQRLADSVGDVDQSGTVDIFDLAYVARYIYQSPAPSSTATPVPPTPALVPIQAVVQNVAHQNLTIPLGSLVLWTNPDAPHTSTSKNSPGPDGLWESRVLSLGQSSAPIAFNTPGTFPYSCRIHPSMQITVTITQ